MSRVAAPEGSCAKSGPQASSRTDGPNSNARFMAHLLLKKKAGQASISLSRFRDLLPSRHGRPAQNRASGFIASEVHPNIQRCGVAATVTKLDLRLHPSPVRPLFSKERGTGG